MNKLPLPEVVIFAEAPAMLAAVRVIVPVAMNWEEFGTPAVIFTLPPDVMLTGLSVPTPEPASKLKEPAALIVITPVVEEIEEETDATVDPVRVMALVVS